ncbi:uncharacterized protein BDW47DRAFT_131892 [Aspergillus candidus]|uniref:Uncharacterized protein n=1 Tax=Aspergillus candidus TaxID=41067 RepID=A0A2I2FAG3_ASPCN|nr:hypothetical protein BDW47DRAFT_131892 [Aspergillus candidus]PLB37619.1 hypothetical protein BDW47DRAFT_131892 [Aspergillus candidus]
MSTIGTLYQQSMLRHPYGYALYEPESTKTLKPGSCGYLTELGQWTPLIGEDQAPINLGDSSSLSRNGLKPFEQFYRAPTDKRAWGPKVCGQVKQRKLELDIGAGLIPAGIPADVGALYRPVTKEFVYGATAFRVWCKENSRMILRQWPDVRERGLVIVTSTYSTDFAMLNAWTDTAKELSVGFRAGVVGIGELGPSCTWYTANGESGWVSVAAGEADEKKVVFFGGLCFRYRRLGAILPSSHAFSAFPVEKAKFRAGDPDAKEFQTVDEGEDGAYEVMVTAEEHGEMINLPGSNEGNDEYDDF